MSGGAKWARCGRRAIFVLPVDTSAWPTRALSRPGLVDAERDVVWRSITRRSVTQPVAGTSATRETARPDRRLVTGDLLALAGVVVSWCWRSSRLPVTRGAGRVVCRAARARAAGRHSCSGSRATLLAGGLLAGMCCGASLDPVGDDQGAAWAGASRTWSSWSALLRALAAWVGDRRRCWWCAAIAVIAARACGCRAR